MIVWVVVFFTINGGKLLLEGKVSGLMYLGHIEICLVIGYNDAML